MGIDKGWGNKGGLMIYEIFFGYKKRMVCNFGPCVFLCYFEYLWSEFSFILLLLIFFVIVVKVL